MVGLLVITHIGLGNCLIECAAHVLGERPQFTMSLGVQPHDKPESVLARAREMVRLLDQGDGVLILTDMLGATPSNIARQLLRPGRVEALAGVNLPMIVRALTYRNEPLDTVAEKAMSGCIAGALRMEMKEC
jgi:PTS system ascorbate-specific IIA component